MRGKDKDSAALIGNDRIQFTQATADKTLIGAGIRDDEGELEGRMKNHYLPETLDEIVELIEEQYGQNWDIKPGDAHELIDVDGNFHLENFGEMISSKNIKVNKNYHCPLLVQADSNLINIMILNLLKNAIYHNQPDGELNIICDPQSLSIKNTGKKLEINEDDLFKRFIKSSYKPDSLGLGLAIVKRICDYYHFQIKYAYQNHYHTITIYFFKK